MIGIDRRAAEPRRDRPPSPRHDPEQDAARNGWSQVAQCRQGRGQEAGDKTGWNTAPRPGEGGGGGRGGRAALAAIGLDLDIDRKAQLRREKQRFFERRYHPSGKFRRKPSTGIKAANSGKAVGRDAALSGRRPVEPRVMTQDERAVAGEPHIELDPAAAEVLGPELIADLDDIGDLADPLRRQLADMDEAVARTEEVHKGAEIDGLDDLARVNDAEFGFGDDAADPVDRGFRGVGIDRGYLDRAVIVDIDFGAGRLDDLADDLAARPDDLADLVL